MKKWLLSVTASIAATLGASSCSQSINDIKEDAIVIDVRTTQEWNTGHIKDANLLPMDQLQSKIEALVPDKSTQVVLYCRSGNRAGQMLSVMKKMGYEDVINAGGVRDAASLLKAEVIK